jgi:hypothetical protein
MNIEEKEVTRWELSSVDIPNVYRADRNNRIQLWWTPVEEFKAFALNILSPLGHVFWNFGWYHTFTHGEFEYRETFREKESRITHINALIRDTGAELDSELASELLYGFAGNCGDRYSPPEHSQPYGLSTGRHGSFAIPESCQPQVSRYFHEQLRVFAQSAVRSCPEDAQLTYSGEYCDPTLDRLLAHNIFMMSAVERNACLALIRSGFDILAEPRPEHYMFTARVIAIWTAGINTKRAELLEEFAEIARFRVDMAIRYGSLRVVEKLKRNLGEKEWGLLCLADLRDELRGKLGTVLARYPVIENNPFELMKR